MNIANSRFTISTMAVAVCAMVALVAAEPAQAAQGANPAASPAATSAPVQRIVIVGQRLRIERVAAVEPKPVAL